MATAKEERLKAMTAAHRRDGKSKDPEAIATEALPADDDALDLEDHATQENILNPEGTDIELSYGAIKLFPPSAMVAKLAAGFCSGILASASEKPSRTIPIFTMHVAEKLFESPATILRLFRLVAYMCGKPGKIDEEQAIELATEMIEKTNANDDVATLFTHLLTVTGMNKPTALPEKKGASPRA